MLQQICETGDFAQSLSQLTDYKESQNFTLVSARYGGCLLRSGSLRSGEDDKHLHMLSVLGWWSLVMFEPSKHKY